MELDITSQALLGAGMIFLLRVGDMTLDTLRVLFVMRGRKAIAWFLGFFQAVIFVLAISSVLSNLDNILNIIGYAAGFATGNVVGMYIEGKLAVGHIQVSIVSPYMGAAVAEALRKDGYAVTEIPARGKDGAVSLLSCSVRRRRLNQIHRLVNEIDPDAFITAEDVSPVRRGFWRA